MVRETDFDIGSKIEDIANFIKEGSEEGEMSFRFNLKYEGAVEKVLEIKDIMTKMFREKGVPAGLLRLENGHDCIIYEITRNCNMFKYGSAA